VIWKLIVNWLMGAFERTWVDLWGSALRWQARGLV
jgi:hypothetical protein